MEQQEETVIPYLPHYIILHILTFLERKELCKCKEVNKTWHKVTLSECFGWLDTFLLRFNVFCAYPVIFNSISTENDFAKAREGTIFPFSSTFVEKGPDRYSLHFSKNDKTVKVEYLCHIRNLMLKDKLQHKNDTEKEHESVLYAQQLITTCMTNPKLWRMELRECMDSRRDHNYTLIFELNIRVLEKLVEAGKEVPMLAEIIKIASDENTQIATKFLDSVKHGPAHIPVKTVSNQPQPNRFAKNFKLYKYQLDAVNWMKSVEEDVNKGFEYTDLIPWRYAKTSVMFNMDNIQAIPAKDIELHIKRANPKGGILADEMGLGKTAEVIGVILANPGDSSGLVAANTSKRSKRIVRNIRCKDHLFKTNATLVLCPAHLVRQWLEEIEKYTCPPLNVLMWNNVRELKACTYYDIINADVVVFSHQMLDLQSYEDLAFTVTRKEHGLNETENDLYNSHVDWLNEALNIVWNSEYPIHNKLPILEHFYWRRLVIDEAHEFKYHSIDFTAKYRWYMTGTPFTTTYDFSKICEFLKFPYKNKFVFDIHEKYIYVKMFLNHLYWRNTQESIKKEYEIPPTVQNLVLLDLDPIERVAYKDTGYHRNSETQMLGHLQLVYKYPFAESDFSLTQFRTFLLEDLEDKIALRALLITQTETKISEFEKKKKEMYVEIKSIPAAARHPLKREIDRLNRAIRSSNKTISSYDTSRNILKEIFNELTQTPHSSYNGPSMAKFATFQEFEEDIIEEEKDVKDRKDETSCEGNKKGENGVPEIPWSEILDMTIPKLKAEIRRRGIIPTSTHRKADLQKTLKEAVKQKNQDVAPEEDSEAHKGKRKQHANLPAKVAKKVKRNASSNHKKVPHEQIDFQNLKKWWIEMHGTKLGNFLFYLKRLWAEDPSAKLLVFSRFSELLDIISNLLYSYHIKHAYADRSARIRVREITAFKKNSTIRIALLNIKNNASGTNIIEASHVILMEPYHGIKNEASSLESQAIARAYRQGQVQKVTVVRFITRNTLEYDTYVAHYGKLDVETEQL